MIWFSVKNQNSNKEESMPEDFLKSVRLAERFVRLEELLNVSKRNQADASVIENTQRMFDECRAKLMEDSLAVALLPQARTAVRMLDAREMVINRTTLGRLIDALEDLAIIAAGFREDHEISPMEDEEDNGEWRAFRGGVKKRGMKRTFQALRNLLVGVKYDLLYTSLPPMPPKYRIPQPGGPARHQN
jgi:hypothetical protein